MSRKISFDGDDFSAAVTLAQRNHPEFKIRWLAISKARHRVLPNFMLRRLGLPPIATRDDLCDDEIGISFVGMPDLPNLIYRVPGVAISIRTESREDNPSPTDMSSQQCMGGLSMSEGARCRITPVNDSDIFPKAEDTYSSGVPNPTPKISPKLTSTFSFMFEDGRILSVPIGEGWTEVDTQMFSSTDWLKPAIAQAERIEDREVLVQTDEKLGISVTHKSGVVFLSEYVDRLSSEPALLLCVTQWSKEIPEEPVVERCIEPSLLSVQPWLWPSRGHLDYPLRPQFIGPKKR